MSAGEGLPSVFLPGLLCTPRLYSAQLAAAWAFGPVMVADHTRDDTVGAIARRVLAAAPPRFALVGLSMGGYISGDHAAGAGAGREAGFAGHERSSRHARAGRLAAGSGGARAQYEHEQHRRSDAPEPAGPSASR